MIRLTNNIFTFSLRLKGPKNQREALKNNLIMQRDDRVEDFFKQYYQNTVQLYKSNFTTEELANSNQMVKRIFSLQNATPSEILKYRIAEATKKYQKNPTDIGSPAVQAAAMCERVIFQMIHTKKYPKDTKGARYLVQLLSQRRKTFDYLMRTDYHRYKWICIDYGVPEVQPKHAHHSTNFTCKHNSWSGI